MSEKRFTFFYERGNEVVFKDNGKILSNKQLVELLNEQQATIDRLKNAINIAYEEKPYPKLEDIKAKYKELEDGL